MKIKIVEVGPRDGLQNESQVLTLEQKLQFILLLRQAGHKNIEAGAFVNPQRVPQMADTKELLRKLATSGGKDVSYWSLVPNSQGYADALASHAKNIAIFTAASETFNQRNINASIDESFIRFQEFVPLAKKKKIKVRGYVSTAFGCPFEGKIEPRAVFKVVERLLKLGVQEISVGDTIGIANPTQVRKMSKALLKIVSKNKLALHVHDTRGTALANILAGLEEGIQIFDSSSGGLGGCPFAPGAAGNVATDDLVYMLNEMGCDTGIKLPLQVKASEYVQRILGRSLPSRYLQAALAST